MPRRPRIHLDNVPLHIVQRGHNRRPCFLAEADYRHYLDWLAEALIDARCALHAYCLMTNHVHLLLTPAIAAAVPEVLISLGRRYVQHVNRLYGRTGTLWDSRYKSSIVQDSTYLITCQRYIELNPVRACMVGKPEDYRWSSYRANAFGVRNPLVTPHSLYRDLGSNERDRRAAYRRLFEDDVALPVLAELRVALNRNRPFGDESFLKDLEARTGIGSEPKPRGRPRKALHLAP